MVRPRVCGGAIPAKPDPIWPAGPSPRVRGSRAQEQERRVAKGSIPACAGEPSRRLSMSAIGRVHPRVCGGAFSTGTADGYG